MPREGSKPQIDSALVHQLAQLLDETGLTEIEYGTQEWHLRVAKGSLAPAAFAAVAAPSAPAAAIAAVENDPAKHPGAVLSPMVGVAYIRPEPDAAPFIQVGDEVRVGQTLVLIEAMKVFNPIKCVRAGKVTRVLVANGAPVEYGEPLLIVE
ncbi:acetyl-CoA carboxylase biotin carboxyl carrier protein [Shumkonia mesophila]|uniref:acetyl-CoA carboxylase biotin carboxyl carrier protein n=1 Tax=Shumkonia mesophila TaxID=2838854 RepID=UPI0029347891|nr:biotin/lipoyl-containing protein [Shumkonia mesophila]